MKKLISLLLLLQCAYFLKAQSIKKYPIGTSPCQAYFFCNPGTFDVSYSEDSSKVFTGECVDSDVHYGLICVSLAQTITDLTVAEDVLVSYLEYLKSSFKVVKSVGYGKGHRLKNSEQTRGVIDYWNDDEKNNWKVKGWTNGQHIVVMFAYSKNALPEEKVNVFLDGLLF